MPRENGHPERYAPFESSSIPSNMLDDDIGYETLVEDFNAYSMSNGMTLSVKSVVGQVGKTKFYTVQGEPLYTVHTVPVIKITSGA